MLSTIRKSWLFKKIQPGYHYSLAFLGALIYRFPSRYIKVVAITGTKGKTTTTELTSALLEAGGYRTALVSTLRFKIGDESERNLMKMTTPGRFFLQRFLRQAVNAKCDYVVMELSSEAAKLHRHAFIHLDALIFTNLAPEHIESHGSYENYRAAKLSIAHSLSRSKKSGRVIITNSDDKEGEAFLAYDIPTKIRHTLENARPYEAQEKGTLFSYHGEKITTTLPGLFNVANILEAAAYAESQGVTLADIKRGIENFNGVAGRMQYVYAENREKQNFEVIVDYAHTPDSLEAVYKTFAGKKKMICVLGSCGGGRDTWKRPAMAKMAEKHCDEIILTNEDPYDDDPQEIINDLAQAITKPYTIIIDRREAISSAIDRATAGSVVLLTGKGTDPCIMGPHGSRTPWDEASVAKEELEKHLG